MINKRWALRPFNNNIQRPTAITGSKVSRSQVQDQCMTDFTYSSSSSRSIKDSEEPEAILLLLYCKKEGIYCKYRVDELLVAGYWPIAVITCRSVCRKSLGVSTCPSCRAAEFENAADSEPTVDTTKPTAMMNERFRWIEWVKVKATFILEIPASALSTCLTRTHASLPRHAAWYILSFDFADERIAHRLTHD